MRYRLEYFSEEALGLVIRCDRPLLHPSLVRSHPLVCGAFGFVQYHYLHWPLGQVLLQHAKRTMLCGSLVALRRCHLTKTAVRKYAFRVDVSQTDRVHRFALIVSWLPFISSAKSERNEKKMIVVTDSLLIFFFFQSVSLFRLSFHQRTVFCQWKSAIEIQRCTFYISLYSPFPLDYNHEVPSTVSLLLLFFMHSVKVCFHVDFFFLSLLPRWCYHSCDD